MGTCPGAILDNLNMSRGRGGEDKEAFFEAVSGFDVAENNRTVGKVQEADADDAVFFIMAHDDTLSGVVEFFPKGANEWKMKGWAERVRWIFLKDFEGAVDLK